MSQSSQSFQERAATIRARLQELGVTSVTAEYDGYADEGAINDIDLTPEPATPIENTFKEILYNFFYDLLEERFDGWENNDGAFGEFTWDLQTDTIRHEHKSRYIDYEIFEHTISFSENQH
ncbi:MAG: hypothetical protein D6690_14610 [Nitrospirae bacterium]|nr:MAG: hypothetical protein D6690_14610 [Nitrospirota bacterium]